MTKLKMRKKLLKPLKVFVTLVLPIIAIFLSAYAIYIDSVHFNQSVKVESQRYEELTIPHTQNQEILDMLDRLDAKIKRSQVWVSSWTHLDPTYNFRVSLSLAQQLADEAEKCWRDRDYSKAKESIDQAYKVLGTIPEPPPTPAPTRMIWWLILGIVAAVVAVGVGIIVAIFRLRES